MVALAVEMKERVTAKSRREDERERLPRHRPFAPVG